MEYVQELLDFIYICLVIVSALVMVVFIGNALYKLLFRNPSPRQSGFSKKSF